MGPLVFSTSQRPAPNASLEYIETFSSDIDIDGAFLVVFQQALLSV